MDEDIEVVPFTEALIEGYLDLAERDDSTDPLYGEQSSREERRERLNRQVSSGITRSHLVALKGDFLVGNAKANLPPKCGEEMEVATLSMMVHEEHRREGIGTHLLNRLCEELRREDIEWIEIGALDSWKPWREFLKKNGFESYERCADVALPSDAHVPDFPVAGVSIRPIRIPAERDTVISIYNTERSKDLPMACAVEPGQPAWWEMEPWASDFEPESLLVAFEDDSQGMVGYVSSGILPDSQGLVHYVDVKERTLGKGLRKALLSRAVQWLRGKGASEIHSRVHVGYRGEEKLFEDLGFIVKQTATVWRRETK
ncbi:MAG: GNAT family N-acetyltransferase [Thermoplasmata archaeon]